MLALTLRNLVSAHPETVYFSNLCVPYLRSLKGPTGGAPSYKMLIY